MGLSPIALDLGFFQLRWYSLAYLAGIVVGWWYLLKLLDRPGAPMARRHADDMVFYATLGILIGGRLGYVLFYRPEFYLANPGEIPQVWDGECRSTAA
jgi:phosphatidylglycerol:prolipoprotein diacylglycerol transferase